MFGGPKKSDTIETSENASISNDIIRQCEYKVKLLTSMTAALQLMAMFSSMT